MTLSQLAQQYYGDEVPAWLKALVNKVALEERERCTTLVENHPYYIPKRNLLL